MANTGNSDKWYFTKEQLENTPSRKCGYDSFKELSYRQQAANFIQDMGQRLRVSQLCINTAIVYMHRFYVFHSFTNFPWHQMAAAALFLAAKVEEQPRKLEHVIKIANICRNNKEAVDTNSERYIAQYQDLVFNENVLLQTLGFDVAIDHPHTHVVRCCHLVRASKDLAQSSYFMASNSLHLTTMCIQYKPTVVACFCILVACKWSNWEIPLSNEKKEWYSYVDPTVTAELLQQLTNEFLEIFENCPSRLKEKIMAISDITAHTSSHSNSPFDTEPKKTTREDGKDPHLHRVHDSKSGSEDSHKHRSSRAHDGNSSGQQSREQREREYKERKEREKFAAQQKAMMSGKPISHGHHRPPVDPKQKHSRPPSVGFPPNNRVEPRDILREASRDSPFGLANIRDPSREHSKNPNQVRSEKDVQKRDYLLKANVQADTNSLNNISDSRIGYSAEKQRIDPNRSRGDTSKVSSKHETVRRHDEQKPYIKSEADNIKKHLSATVHDKSSAYLNKSLNSTSQKIKSPFAVDASKSVPKSSSSQANAPSKPHHHNGSSNGSYSLPLIDNDIKIKQEPYIKEEIASDIKSKQEPVSVKEEIPTPPVIKRPSLFSPEKTPPHKRYIKSSPRRSSEQSATALSPIISPESKRSRNYSSSSEPELRPVMKKIDQVEGFENLMRDNTIGINKIRQVPDITPIMGIKQEPNPRSDPKFSDVISSQNKSSHSAINGLETNPTLISNLLKEAPTLPHLPKVAAAESSSAEVVSVPQQTLPEPKEKEREYHHKSKKKKEKHKHKDKDKNREDKEKKKKHKDKDREKHKHKEKQEPPAPVVSEPIKIKIQNNKIHPPSDSSQSGSLKIKIPKDKIKTESIGEPSQPPPLPQPSSGGLKIKIPKEVIKNCSSSEGSNSKKRDRDRSSLGEGPPAKISKSGYRESKQNGRHSYNKVAHMGDGDTSLHRLAESKYINKSSSS